MAENDERVPEEVHGHEEEYEPEQKAPEDFTDVEEAKELAQQSIGAWIVDTAKQNKWLVAFFILFLLFLLFPLIFMNPNY